MSPYVKTILRSIRMTLPRFIAIFAIIALGVGFFSGLKVTTPSFIYTADIYTKETSMFDFKMLSTIGFTDEDIDELARRTGCVVEGAYSVDCSAYLGDSVATDTVRFLSITQNVNHLSLESGRLPSRPDEIVIDGYHFSSIEPGTKLVISDETSDSSMDMLKYKEYTVVGTARSPVYMNFQRGTSNEGSGSVSFYVCALPGAFDSEYFTEAYLYANTGLYIFSDEYKDWAKNAEKQYKVMLASVIDDRFDETLREEYDKLYDGIDEFNEGISDGQDELEDARKKLDNARKELEDGQTELDKKRKELEDGKATLDDSKSQLDDYQRELTSTKVLLDAAESKVDREKAELDALKEDIDTLYQEIFDGRSDLRTARTQTSSRIASLEFSISYYESTVASLQAGIENNKAALEQATTDVEKQRIEGQIASQEEQLSNYQTLIEEAQAEIAELEAAAAGFDDIENELDEKQKTYEDKLSDYSTKYQTYMSDKMQYEMGLSSYESSKAQFDSAYSQYSDGLTQYYDGLEQIEDAQQKIDDGWKEYNDGVYELWKGYTEFSYTADTVYRSNLVYGFELLDSVDEPEVYILGRDKNTGYLCFDNDSKIVDGVASVFPIFFSRSRRWYALRR